LCLKSEQNYLKSVSELGKEILQRDEEVSNLKAGSMKKN